MDDLNWIVASTKPNAELLAVEQLAHQGFEAYCPTYDKVVRHARKKTIKKKPLFPSYIFVQSSDRGRSWRPILSTSGVRSLVMQGNKPGVLPRKFVEELKVCERNGELSRRAEPKLNAGDKVILTEGAFQDFIGQVLFAQEDDRVWLMLDLMGREVRVSQRAASIRRA